MASLLTVNVFAAEETVFPDVAQDYAYKNAIYSLVEDGIINGISEDGVLKFKPDKTITRAEFATMLAKYLIGDVSLLTERTDKFPDCTNHWANTYIAYAVDADIINGYEDGTFRPDNPVKYGEAIKMLVCAKNYGNLYKTTSPWYSGWIEIAKDMNLTNNAFLVDGSLPANRGLVAQLVYNMDYTKKLNVSDKYDDGGYEEDEVEYEEFTGVVKGVFKKTLTGESLGLAKNEIMVGGQVFRIKDGADIEDYNKYLGKMVEVFYTEGSYNKIVRIEEASDNDTFTISADDIFNVTSQKIEFYNEDDEEDEVKLSDNLYVIYNGQGVAKDKIDEEFIETYFDIDCGEITLMNNNGGKDYEIAYVTSYDTYFVKARKLEKDVYTFTDYTSTDRTVSLKNNDDDYIVYKASKVGEKQESSVSGIATSNVVLSVAKPLSTGVTEAIVSTVVLKNATVKSMVGYDEVKIEEKYYSVSDYYMDFIDENEDTYGFEVGDRATFYLDYAGRIVYVSKTESTDPYGYIMAYDDTSDGFDSEGAVMLLDNKGVVQEYPLKSKVRLNGTSVENSKVASTLEENAKIINDGKSNGKNDTWAQLVRYATSTENGKTVVSELYTIDYKDLDSGEIVPGELYTGTKTKCTAKSENTRTFVTESGSRFVVNSSTTVFLIPDDRTDKNAYKKSSYSYFNGDNEHSYAIEAYDIDKNTAKAVLVYTGDNKNSVTISESAEVKIIADIRDVNNPDDPQKPLTQISYYTAGSKDLKTIIVAEDADKDKVLDGLSRTGGDLVRFATEGGEVVAIQKVFVGGELYEHANGKIEADSLGGEGGSTQNKYSGDDDYFRVIHGTVDSFDGDELYIVPQIVTDNKDYTGDWEIISVGSAVFYNYDEDASKPEDRFAGEMTLGSLTPATTEAGVNVKDASKVVAVKRENKWVAVYVLD